MGTHGGSHTKHLPKISTGSILRHSLAHHWHEARGPAGFFRLGFFLELNPFFLLNQISEARGLAKMRKSNAKMAHAAGEFEAHEGVIREFEHNPSLRFFFTVGPNGEDFIGNDLKLSAHMMKWRHDRLLLPKNGRDKKFDEPDVLKQYGVENRLDAEQIELFLDFVVERQRLLRQRAHLKQNAVAAAMKGGRVLEGYQEMYNRYIEDLKKMAGMLEGLDSGKLMERAMAEADATKKLVAANPIK